MIETIAVLVGFGLKSTKYIAAIFKFLFVNFNTIKRNFFLVTFNQQEVP